MIYWHYTNGFAIFEILRDGAVLPGRPRDGENPGAFFTCAETYLTCDVCGTKIPDEPSACFPECFRIGIDPEACSSTFFYWPEMVERMNMSERWARGREGNCHSGAPRRWAVSLEPVLLLDCAHVEYADGMERYHPLTLAYLLESWRTGMARLSDDIRRACGGILPPLSSVDIELSTGASSPPPCVSAVSISTRIERIGKWLAGLAAGYERSPEETTVLKLLRSNACW